VQLKEPGDSCLIDFHDIASWLAHELKKNDIDFNRRDRVQCGEVVWAVIDNFFTEKMTWTKRRAEFSAETYLRMMPVSIDRHFSPHDLADELITRVDQWLRQFAEFPTWHYFDLHRHGEQVSITMGEDFRLEDWMRRFGKEYGCGEHSW
jgi:hypothetical protein